MGATERVREVFQKILQPNLVSLVPEIETLLHYTLKHDVLEQTENPWDKIQEVLNVLLVRGEEACQGVLENLNQNQHLFPRILRILSETRADMPMFKLVIEDLGLDTFLQQKLTLSDFQSIGCRELSDASCHSLKDIPIHFLRHLMALNIHEAFRIFDFNRESAQNNPEQNTSGTILGSVHPLDVLCALLHCSDNFLRQEIIRRISMCQVPLPLLIPAGVDTHGTFLLWAMRGITKSLSLDHKGLIEDDMVDISLPVFSFVSLGECRYLSIAKTIDQILNATQQRSQNHLMDRAMSWGNLPRLISNGLVEISCCFSVDQMDLKPFKKPFAMTNLHGDLQSSMRQFYLLTQVSSAVFILVENMTEQQQDLLLHIGGNNTNYYFIAQDQCNQESNNFCSRLLSDFGLSEQNVLLESDEKFNEKLLFILKDIMQKSPKEVTLSEMSMMAMKSDFCSDENQSSCEYGRLHSLDLIDDVVNTIGYNEKYVKQQQHLKIQIAKIEKELCRVKDQGELQTEVYKSKLTNERCNLLVAQSHHNYSDISTNLQYAFTYLNTVEKQYFLKWLQFQKFSTDKISSETIHEIVFCKIRQMYETELLAGRNVETTRFCSNFPKAAVDLLLQGIPLELIDGDTVNVHLQWITDVLTELDTRTRGQCRIRVISILGVQDTGKSTLLNTMFGLQFPTSHRQRARGAVMSLIKVEERDLGCDFLVVIDCEGLRALEMASMEESYDHDNELATLVAGLSDIAIINMALGSTSEMRNILQIVIHALQNMKGTGQKQNYLLVYQNMEGATSEEPMIDVEEMLGICAQNDKSSRFPRYNDTTECNILKDCWIIPPFGMETSCYSEKVVELKCHLLQMIKYQSQPNNFRNVLTFAADIKALWNSVKCENHIFRFKNILEENIYTELYERFLNLELNLCRKMHSWWMCTEEWISSHAPDELHTQTLVPGALRMLNKEVKMLEDSLKVYFSDNSQDKNSQIAKKFEAEFMKKVESLKSLLETHYKSKCLQIIILRHGLANTILEDFFYEEQDPDETNFDVELYWNNAVAEYKTMTMKYRDIKDEFLQLLRQDMRTKGSLVTEFCHRISNLSDYSQTCFSYDEKYLNESYFLEKCNHMENCVTCHNKRKGSTRFLLEKSYKYAQKIVGSKTAYDPVHGMEILNMVNEVIREDTMPYRVLFEIELKFQTLSQAALLFQKQHDDLLQECATQFHVGNEVIGYLKHVQQDKRIVEKYCRDWLKPVVEIKVKNLFKQKIVSEFTNHLCAVRMRRPSEGSRGLRSIHHAPVEDTMENICHRYTDRKEIQILFTQIISGVIENIRKMLHHPDVIKSGNFRVLQAAVQSVLEEGMSGGRGVLSNDPFEVTILNVLQCSSYLDFFVQKLEKQIQEEFSSKSIEEHYMECSYPTH